MARLLAALILASTLLAPANASAGFVATTAPFPAESSLSDFDAGDARWIASAQVDGELRVAVSGDRGASWSTFTYPGESTSVDVAAAPDGALWLGGRKSAATDEGGLLYRLAPGSLTPSPVTFAGFGLGGDPSLPYMYETSAPVFDSAGNPWVAVTVENGGGASGHLVRLAGPGGGAAQRLALPAGSLSASVDRLGTQVYVLGSEYLRLDGSTLTPVPRPAKWRHGDRAVDGAGARSHDGGLTFEGGSLTSVRAVHGADLVIAGPSVLGRSSEGLSATGLTDAPPGWFDAVQTDDGIVVPGEDNRIYVHAGAVPVVAPATGLQVRRVNELRTAAGLAPVREDARLSHAAAGHVAYWLLNGFSAHDQFADLPGYTGASPAMRCQAAGYPEPCAEVAYPERSANAVDGWVATPYHGRPLVHPDATDFGGAERDGTGAVINSSLNRGIRFTPAPFPHGSYDGDLIFYGESPDPVSDCLDSGQDVSWPLGATIFLHPPTGGSARVTGLARAADGVPLHGCKLEGMFLPDDGLAPHTTYRATGMYNGSYDGPDRPFQWEFTTGPDRDTYRGGSATTKTTTTTTTSGTRIVRPGGTGLRFGLGALRLPRLRDFARKGLTLPVTCTPACRASATLRLSARDARRARLGRRALTLGTSKLSSLSGAPKLEVVPARKLRKRVRRQRRLTIQIVLSATPAGGSRATLRHTITLRR